MATAAEKGVGAGEELVNGKGLGDVVIGAEVEAEEDVGFLTLGGEHEDGEVAFVGAEAAAEFVAVDLERLFEWRGRRG